MRIPRGKVKHIWMGRGMMNDMRNMMLTGFAVFGLAAATRASTNLPPSPIVQVWGGGRHTMALLKDGSVWTWGSNVSGKLGNGEVSDSYDVTNHDSFMPIQVHGPGNVGYLNSIVAISAGESHNTALKSDGTVWTWGWNAFGQLGDGTTNDAHTPIKVAGLTERGGHQRLARLPLSRSEIRRHGVGLGISNQYGQLGNGANTFTFLPVQVIGPTNPAAISAGYTTSTALMSNGTVRVWGTGLQKAELGQGNFGDHSYTPIMVMGLSQRGVRIRRFSGTRGAQIRRHNLDVGLEQSGTAW